MKFMRWQITLAASLIATSVIIFLVQIFIFNNPDSTLFYLLQDIAFVPLEVLLVVLIIDRLLERREKAAMLEKMNMVIGAFFTEAGRDLLKALSEFDLNREKVRKELAVKGNWSDEKFAAVSARLKGFDYKVDSKKADLEILRGFLAEKRDFIMRLLENPNLLEHESFTDLLWAVSHLMEELSCRACRADFKSLPETDYAHLSGDIKRAYALLISEWLDYMRHLKVNYPYLFSLAMRTNPFDINASPIVGE